MKPVSIEKARQVQALAQKAASSSPLLRAKAAAQGEYPEIPRTRVATVRMKSGGSYSYSYADLADVFSAVRPVNAAHGLSVTQWPDGLTLMTRVAHESGEYEDTPWPIKPLPQRSLEDSQSFQSAVQVAKRYALSAALGIATEETIEGDNSRKRGLPDGMNEKFETGDGTRMPVGAKITSDMTPRQRAEEARRAIIDQFNSVKTQVGLNGVWNRNQDFIAILEERHRDLYDEVFDVFERQMDEKPAPKGVLE